jgi:hypothetical protein
MLRIKIERKVLIKWKAEKEGRNYNNKMRKE